MTPTTLPNQFDQIQTQMKMLGFRWQPLGRTFGTWRIGAFYKRIETKRGCLCNENVNFVVELTDYNVDTRVRPDLERYVLTADITGEYVSETWAKLTVYSLSPEKFFAEYLKIQASLVAAWEALA